MDDNKRTLAIALAAYAKAQSGGDSGGTTNYNDLLNKPSINGIHLIGNVTIEDLGISYDDLNDKPTINGVTLENGTTLKDLGLNEMWVGTSAKYEQDKETIPDGTLVFITDDDNIDKIPTANSTNFVESGGVYSFVQNGLNEKVDKVSGKGLSTNDFTNVYKTQIDTNTSNISNLNTIKADKTSVKNGELTIKRNNVSIGTFTANSEDDAMINIVIPVKASDVSALPDTTKYAASISVSLNSSTYVMTLTLKDQNNNILGAAQTIDLPLETMVVGGSYDSVNKKVILTLKNGNTIEFSVADLVAGLQTEITNQNKLDADLVDDTNSINKFVTQVEKNKIAEIGNEHIELTQAEYDNLGNEKYSDNKEYFITDGNTDDKAIVYGFHIDPDESDPSEAVTYLADAIGMTPAAMGTTTFNYGTWQDAFFMPKPCMLKYDGTVDYYLDPNDYSKKLDGTSSDITNPNYEGNAMMEWGLIWYKFEQGTTNGEGYFYVSNKRVDDTYHCWCNYDCDNNIIDHFYTAIYNGTGNKRMRSLSGVQLTAENGNGSTTGAIEVEMAVNNNATDKIEWYTDILSDYQLITMLLVLIGKSIDIQAKFGRGLDTGNQSAKEAYVTGTLNDKGLFWGDTANNTSAVKVFGIENFYGCVWHRVAGMVGTNYEYKIKLTHGTIDGSTAEGFNSNGTRYIDLNLDQPSANGFIKYCKFTDYGFVPINSAGSSTTYYIGHFYKGTGYLLVGGGTSTSSSSSAHSSPFCVNLSLSFSNASWGASTFLSCKPLAQNSNN